MSWVILIRIQDTAILKKIKETGGYPSYLQRSQAVRNSLSSEDEQKTGETYSHLV